jgi:hypothetical protein
MFRLGKNREKDENNMNEAKTEIVKGEVPNERRRIFLISLIANKFSFLFLGKYNTAVKLDTCLSCNAGKFQALAAQTFCNSCAVGYVSFNKN